MKRPVVLYLTYWYPNKSNKSFGIFVKRHAHSIGMFANAIVVHLNISRSNKILQIISNKFIDDNGIETHEIALNSRFYKVAYVLLPIQYLILRKYIRSNLKEYTFNIVHSNVIFPCAIVGHHLALKLKCKHVITEHWTKVDKFFSKSLYAYFGKRALNNVDAICCVSEQLKVTVKRYTNNQNIFVIPNIVDSKEFYFDPEMPKNKVFTFVAVANWSQFKRPFYFLNALERLNLEGKIKDFKVILIGEGEQLQKVKAKNYPFTIEYPGTLPAEKINIVFNKSHVFLHGSDFETFSVVIAEALHAGLPCVVSPVGIAKEVINDSNGFIATNSISDWTTKINACYNKKYSYSLICDKVKDQFNSSSVGYKFAQVYDQVL